MDTLYTRTESLIGSDALDTLKSSKILLFGLGGVGGAVSEALIRVGIGHITFVDFDTVDITNLNRQIIGLHSTLGKGKAELWKTRAIDINPEGDFSYLPYRVTEENITDFKFSKYDYIIDAIDDVKGKLAIIKEAKKEGIPIISSMGTGNKLDPTRLKIASINQTKVCPLAKRVRKELKKINITDIDVLYSEEDPIKLNFQGEKGVRQSPSSISYLPSTAGLLLASHVIRTLIK